MNATQEKTVISNSAPKPQPESSGTAETSRPRHPQRYHALDATRAFALLLGVVFHTVWFYTEFPFNTPVKDVSAGPFYSWFFETSHSFRMQLFFVIAGFFARLVCQKRGLKAFARNRFSRIVLPFVIGWLILYPLLITTWMWGMNDAGQIDLPVSPWLVGIGFVLSPSILVPRSDGGTFGLAHLWFLYYLLIIYVLVFCVRGMLHPWTKRVSGLGDRLFRILTRNPLGALGFALLLTPIMGAMTTWAVDTPAFSYVPQPMVVALYGAFFVFGWFLHRHAEQLGTLFHQWRLYLIGGLLVSLGTFAIHYRTNPADVHLPLHSVSYRDVTDWSVFLNSLRALENADESNFAQRQLWTAFPPHVRNSLQKDAPFFDQRYGILTEINRILADPKFPTPEFEPQIKPHIRRAKDLSVLEKNRATVIPTLEGVAATEYRIEPWYPKTKWLHAGLYSLMMVFLVYGSLGAFQALVTQASPTWRYLADSSYWVYLAHIPLVPAIETLVYDLPYPSWIKCPFVCLSALVILYATYHYCVRSTFIGKTLNGQKHPFHWNPLRAISER